MSRTKALTADTLAAYLHLDAQATAPLYRQIATALGDLVATGTLSAGERLPPIRDLAHTLGISHITVSQAYGLARREGIVESAPGLGTRIVPRLEVLSGPREGVAQEAPGEQDSHGSVPSWPSFVRSPRTSLLQAAAHPDPRGTGDIIHLGTGQPDVQMLPFDTLRRAWAGALRDATPQDLLYGGAQGDPRVRAALADYCRMLGYAAATDEVLVTTGTQQSIDLVIRTFVRPGEPVLVESPSYPSALDLLESHGCQLVPVPIDAQGLRVDLLPGLLARFRPRLLYLAPTGHNPTGAVLSVPRRAALRALVRDADLLVLEDDVCSEFLYEGQPQEGLRTPETRGHVITLKSFAKTVLPGLRVGCLLAAPPLLGPLTATKALTDRFTSPLAQHALRRYLQGRSLPADLARARETYRARRDILAAELRRALPSDVRWTLPAAGLNVWLTLPPGSDAEDVRRLAAAHGVLCAQGTAFMPNPEGADAALRLTFADSLPAMLIDGAQRLAEALQSYQERGAHGRFKKVSTLLVSI